VFVDKPNGHEEFGLQIPKGSPKLTEI